MDIRLRMARPSDAPALQALWREADQSHHDALPDVFAPPASPARPLADVRALLADPDQGVLVADLAGEVVGFAHLALRQRRPPFVERRFVVIDAVAVAERLRGRGIGRRLMEEARRWAAARGAEELWLDVWAFNDGAIHLYESLGFETISQRMRLRLADAAVDPSAGEAE